MCHPPRLPPRSRARTGRKVSKSSAFSLLYLCLRGVPQWKCLILALFGFTIWSPDKNPGVKNAHDRFARLGVVSKILRDSESRKRYADEADWLTGTVDPGTYYWNTDMTSSTRTVFRNGEVLVTIIRDSGQASGYVDHQNVIVYTRVLR